jgi:hypothetical protein
MALVSFGGLFFILTYRKSLVSFRLLPSKQAFWFHGPFILSPNKRLIGLFGVGRVFEIFF